MVEQRKMRSRRGPARVRQRRAARVRESTESARRAAFIATGATAIVTPVYHLRPDPQRNPIRRSPS
ncbi:hypothetical protein WJ63_12420 [Burkholderia pyrrocinia]|nr:hypothetical protein WJ63_12420 [Burkholderia pyrrocinia]